MQHKKLYITLALVVFLVGIAAFVAGRFINARPIGDNRVSNVTPAPEIPTTTPDITGLLIQRKDKVVILQTVSFDPGSGWHLGDSNAPMDASSGPKVEVVTTNATTIYRDDFEFNPSSVQQTVEESTLDDLDPQMLITVWGRKNGERVIADILLAQHLK